MKHDIDFMIEHYPFEENKERNAPKELTKVRAQLKKINEELDLAAAS